MKKILVCTEVVEELEDIIRMMSCISMDFDAYLYAGKEVNLDEMDLGLFTAVHNSASSGRSLVAKVIDLIKFIYIYANIRPDYIFTGFSMLKYRLVSSFFNSVHCAYFRGVLFDSQNISGISDMLNHSLLGRLGLMKNLLNPYYADTVITTSSVSMKFICERSIKKESIKNIGAIWLSGGRISSSSIKTRVVFITQAFGSHGFPKQHDDQVRSLLIIDEYCHKNQIELIVRKHPRDFFNYSDLGLSSKFVINTSDPNKFIREISCEDVILSPLSTLAFEIIYEGGNVIFYTSSELDSVYKRSYEYLGLTPKKIAELIKCDVSKWGSMAQSPNILSADFDFRTLVNNIFRDTHEA